ncbi:MAG TPA: DUF192 domain-containing protein [candidate division Zixibacteria bacterium]|nr:DUF192 domain-containing protein [candidate division Zixibacteria bacterium]
MRIRQARAVRHGAAALIAAAVLSTAGSCHPQPRVVIETRNGREVAFEVEIADTPAKRELGLQYRRELAEGRGMLFLFPEERENSFWMKNTPIPLDMIFIGGDRRIVGVVHRTTPFSLQPQGVGLPSRFVLEINAGLARRYAIEAGDRVRFEGIAPEKVRE